MIRFPRAIGRSGVAVSFAAMASLMICATFAFSAPPDALGGIGGAGTSSTSGLSASGNRGDTGLDSGVGMRGPVTGPVDPDVYIVGPGDLFQLTLSGPVSRTMLLSVGPEGELLVPGSGAVQLSGLTLNQARQKLLRWLSDEFRGVRLDLHLAQVRLMRVYLTGDVKNPGPIQIPANSRLSEAIPVDALVDRASTRNVEIRRRSGERLIGDLQLFNRTGRYDQNPYLRDGDIVRVPTAIEWVEVQGAVARPGIFELGPGDSLRTLLDLAGGPLPSAQADHALLVRWATSSQAESLWLNLPDIYSNKTNPPLQDGDHAYLFFSSRFHELEQASVYGEVEAPGTYPLTTGQTRLSDLVKAARGFLPRADLSTVRVYRQSRVAETDAEFDRLSRLSRSEMTDSEYEVLRTRLTARREDYRVDWFRLEHAPELDILLRNNDIVRVDPLIASVRVEGEVLRPGIVDFAPKRTAEEYVRLAGGFSERAARGKVRITRAVTGQTLRARDVPTVAPGDLIWVPERPDVTVWQQLQTLIAVTAQVATVIIAVRR